MIGKNVILTEMKLYRYVADTLFKKGYWKECWAVLHANSILDLYKDSSKAKPVLELDLQQAVLWLSFGDDAAKYNAPRMPEGDLQLSPSRLIAVPKDKQRQTVAWLCAEDDASLHRLIRDVARSVAGAANPPLLGARRGEEERIAGEVRRRFGLPEATAEEKSHDWQVYWLHGMMTAAGKGIDMAISPGEIGQLGRQRTNLIDGDQYSKEKPDSRCESNGSLKTTDVGKPEEIRAIDSQNPIAKGIRNGNIQYHTEILKNGLTKTEITIFVRPHRSAHEKRYIDEDAIVIHTLINEETKNMRNFDEYYYTPAAESKKLLDKISKF